MTAPSLYKWKVDRSHMVAVPDSYFASSLAELKHMVEITARLKRRRPIIGLLEYSHLIRDGSEYLLVFFRDQHNAKRRFMRLIREN